MVYRSSRVCRSRGGRQGVRLAYDAVVFTGLSANKRRGRQGVCGYSRHTSRVVFTGPSACADRGGAGRECSGTAGHVSRR